MERAWTARANVNNLRRDEFMAAGDAELVDRLTADWRRFAQPLTRHQDPTFFEEPVPSHRRNDTASTLYWRWTVSFRLLAIPVNEGKVEVKSPTDGGAA